MTRRSEASIRVENVGFSLFALGCLFVAATIATMFDLGYWAEVCTWGAMGSSVLLVVGWLLAHVSNRQP